MSKRCTCGHLASEHYNGLVSCARCQCSRFYADGEDADVLPSSPPSLASETTAPTADEILGALTWARDEANAQCMNAQLDRKSGNGGPWDSYEGVLRWIASALPSLLADRDRVDWNAWEASLTGDEYRASIDAARLRPERPEGAE